MTDASAQRNSRNNLPIEYQPSVGSWTTHCSAWMSDEHAVPEVVPELRKPMLADFDLTRSDVLAVREVWMERDREKKKREKASLLDSLLDLAQLPFEVARDLLGKTPQKPQHPKERRYAEFLEIYWDYYRRSRPDYWLSAEQPAHEVAWVLGDYGYSNTSGYAYICLPGGEDCAFMDGFEILIHGQKMTTKAGRGAIEKAAQIKDLCGDGLLDCRVICVGLHGFTAEALDLVRGEEFEAWDLQHILRLHPDAGYQLYRWSWTCLSGRNEPGRERRPMSSTIFGYEELT